MVATVDDGRVTKLRPDPDHPLSRGYACPKGVAMTEVQNDPDRVLHPLRRTGDGSFERVSWDAALADIGERLRAVRRAHGAGSIGWYMGNPGAFSYSHTLWVKGFLDGLGSPHYYTAGSQDVNNRFAASALMYGSPLIIPIPDLERTLFLFMVGANPMVSHGSVLTAPRVRDQLHEIVKRGGRVVVVDPRRTETARQFQHVPITPDTDAWRHDAVHTVDRAGRRSCRRGARGVAGRRRHRAQDRGPSLQRAAAALAGARRDPDQAAHAAGRAAAYRARGRLVRAAPPRVVPGQVAP
jgi:formate dehydrogenase